MKKRCALLSAAVLVLGSVASSWGADANSPTVSLADKTFLERAAKSGMAEVAISRGALAQLSDPEAKSFAESMIADHPSANTDLQSLATKKGVPLKITDKDAQDLEETWSKKTTGVDRAYVEQMVKDHTETVRLFERGSKSRDPDVASFAAKTLPMLYHHLDMIGAIKTTLQMN